MILAFNQPLTVLQLSRRVGMRASYCSTILGALCRSSFVECLTPIALSSRVYFLTPSGKQLQCRLLRRVGKPLPFRSIPEVPWNSYSFVCHRHRAAVVKSLSEPMQPAQIKRRARHLFPGIRMSANNVRDIIRLFKPHGIVEPVFERKKAHPLYQLTPLGWKLRSLLLNAEGLA